MSAKKKETQKTARIIPFPKAENPARRGTGKYRRINAVMRAATVQQALRRGARASTVRFCVSNRLVRVK
jgi:hypothetical protein